MKNLTLKKVAIGLLLAGYSISGAYAATTISTSTGIIKGRAPLVNAKTLTTPNYNTNSITVKLYDENGQPITSQIQEVVNGYKIRIYLDVVDEDGDKDTLGLTANTVRFGYTKANTTDFIWVNATYNTDTSLGNYAEMTIPQEAIGSKIYYEVLANTEFGTPSQAEKWVFGNVFRTDAAGQKGQQGGGKPSGNEGAGGDDIPDIDDPDPVIKINTSTFDIKLYNVTVSNGAVTYGAEVAPNSSVVVGQSFAPKVFSKQTLVNGQNADITDQFAYQWNLVDLSKQDIVNQSNTTNGSAAVANQVSSITQLEAVNAKVSGTQNEIQGLTYLIPVNGQVKAKNGQTSVSTIGNLAAGAQGYKLQVVAVTRSTGN